MPTSSSETQANLCIDTTISSAGTASSKSTKSAKTTAKAQRLAKTRRLEISYRCCKIHVIKEVLEVYRDIKSVFLFSCRAHTRPATRSTNDYFSSARTTAWTAPANHGSAGSTGLASTSNRLFVSGFLLRLCFSGRRFGEVAERKPAAYPHVYAQRSRSLAKVTRNNLFTRQWHEIEIAEARTLDIRSPAVSIWAGEAWPLICLPI